MATVPFLPKDRTSLYVRVFIPRNLKRHFKDRAELWRTLETLDRDEAAWKAATVEARVRRVFHLLRKNGDNMTKEQVETLIDSWLERELDYAEDCRVLAGGVSDAHRESQLDGLSIMEDETIEALLANDYRKIEKDAEALLKSAGLPPLDHEGAEFGRLCRRLLLAKQEYISIEAERWNGVYAARRTTTKQSSAGSSSATPAGKASPAGPLFSVVVGKFIAETMPPKSRSIKPLRAEILRFVETIKGDKPIDGITKDDARKYKDYLLTVRKLSLLTVGKHVMSLQAIFKFALSQGYLPEGKSNPFVGLAPSKKIIRKTKLRIREFSLAELLTTFGAKNFLAQRKENPSRYWICLMALFMGLRREEAAQAAGADIHQSEEGIYYLQTATDEKLQQNLKNEGSKRRVPVHSSLIALGFLDYVARIKKSGQVRLFPDLTKGGNGFGDAVGKWFGRHLRSHGLPDPTLVFHSTRHTFITNLYAARCPRETVQLLTGHSDGTVHEDYIHKENLPLALLRDGIELLKFDEVVAALTKEGFP